MNRLLLLAVASLLFLGAACSGDDTPSATPTTVVGTITPPSASPATAVPGTPSPAPVGTAPPIDGTVFPQNPGSTEPFSFKSNPDPVSGAATLADVRVGAHPESGGWDRIVFEFKDVRPSGRVEYVTSAENCGSGNAVTLPGQAILAVHFDSTNAHDDNGQLTIEATEVSGPGNAILKSVSTCDFEAVVNWAIGTTGVKNYKVSLLENPARVVIDVKW